MNRPETRNQKAGAAGERAPWSSRFGLRPNQAQALAVMGSNFYQQGRHRSAESFFRFLIAMDSRSHYGYAGVGAVALSGGRLDEALQYLRKAAGLEPNDPTVHANLGETLLRKAMFNEAAAEFETALRLDPTESDPGANRARAVLKGMHMVLTEFRRTQAGLPVS